MKKFSLYLIVACCMLMLAACGQKTELSTVAPFTEAVWESTVEDIITAEGTEYETTVSVYGGDSYIFPKKYLNYDGYVQYMFDGNKALVGVAWFYIGDSKSTASEMYEAIKAETNSLFGKEESLMDSDYYGGNKWSLDDRSVLLVTFSQDDEHAVQISYISSSVNEN